MDQYGPIMTEFREKFEHSCEIIIENRHNEIEDKLFNLATSLVIETQYAATSYLQRTFHIGYNRAARLMEKLENEKIVSDVKHDGSRIVLIAKQDA